MKKISKLFVALFLALTLSVSMMACDKVIEKEIIRMSLSGFETVYDVGDTMSAGTLNITYEDGTTEQISLSKATVSGFNSSKEGHISLTITYKGKTITVPIYINNAVTATVIEREDFDEFVVDIIFFILQFGDENATREDALQMIDDDADIEESISNALELLQYAGFTSEDLVAITNLMDSFNDMVSDIMLATERMYNGDDFATAELVDGFFALYDGVTAILTPSKLGSLYAAIYDMLLESGLEGYEDISSILFGSTKEAIAYYNDIFNIYSVFRKQDSAKVASFINYVIEISVNGVMDGIDYAKAASNLNFIGDIFLDLSNVNVSQVTIDFYMNSIFSAYGIDIDIELMSVYTSSCVFAGSLLKNINSDTLETFVTLYNEMISYDEDLTIEENTERITNTQYKLIIHASKLINETISSMSVAQLICFRMDLISILKLSFDDYPNVADILASIQKVANINPEQISDDDLLDIYQLMLIFSDATPKFI